MPLLAEVAKPEDESYFNSLYQVWELLGITDRVDMGNAYYRRGEDFYKRRDFEAACQDFDRAIGLGYVKAAGRREIVVQVQESIKDVKLKLLREQAEEQAFQQKLLEEKNSSVLIEILSSGIKLEFPGGIILELIKIPAGSFMMGSDEYNSQKPIHQVTLKEFYLGKYPVTQEQYQAVIGNNPSRFKDNPKNPVDCVSWDDAQEFCQKLKKLTGKDFRLPTEAEWEYACRAGTQTRYYFGDKDDQLGEYAWFAKNSDPKTHPVGQKKPNNWGLYDMSGNVLEWCKDPWHDSYAEKPDNIRNDGNTIWLSSNESLHILRGGSGGSDAFRCCSAYRYWYDADNRYSYFGFRLALSFFP